MADKLLLVINKKGVGQWPNVEKSKLEEFLKANKLKKEDVEIRDMPKSDN